MCVCACVSVCVCMSVCVTESMGVCVCVCECVCEGIHGCPLMYVDHWVSGSFHVTDSYDKYNVVRSNVQR